MSGDGSGGDRSTRDAGGPSGRGGRVGRAGRAGSGDPTAPSGVPEARLHVVRFAPAKLNLTLAVTGRRDDGFHALRSVMVPLALGDVLNASTSPVEGSRDSLRIVGLTLAPSPDNLVLQAFAAAREAVAATWHGAPAHPPRLAARLVKHIPIAAGLGGGSSDAAAAIDVALAAWGAHLEPQERLEIAADLGSDVPFFLAGGAALITGRGEFVEPLADITGDPVAVLLVTPHLPVSTADVFKAYSAGIRPSDTARAADVSERLGSAMRAGLSGGKLLAMAAELATANDLLPAAESVAPALTGFREALERLLERPVSQSGSGPTLWSLYANLAEARKAIRFVRLGMSNGALPRIGSGEPFVAATTIEGRPMPPVVLPPDVSSGTIRPLGVHNWNETPDQAGQDSPGEPTRLKGD